MKKYSLLFLLIISFSLSGMKRSHGEITPCFFELVPLDITEKIICNFLKQTNPLFRSTIIKRVCHVWYNIISQNQHCLELLKNAAEQNQRLLQNYNIFIINEEKCCTLTYGCALTYERIIQEEREEWIITIKNIINIFNSDFFDILFYHLPGQKNLLSSIIFNFDLFLLEKLMESKLLEKLKEEKAMCFDKVYVSSDVQNIFFEKIIKGGYSRVSLFSTILPFFTINKKEIATPFFECIMQRANSIFAKERFLIDDRFIINEDERLYSYTNALVEANANCSFFKTADGQEQVRLLNEKDFPKLKQLCESLIKDNIN